MRVLQFEYIFPHLYVESISTSSNSIEKIPRKNARNITLINSSFYWPFNWLINLGIPELITNSIAYSDGKKVSTKQSITREEKNLRPVFNYSIFITQSTNTIDRTLGRGYLICIFSIPPSAYPCVCGSEKLPDLIFLNFLPYKMHLDNIVSYHSTKLVVRIIEKKTSSYVVILRLSF